MGTLTYRIKLQLALLGSISLTFLILNRWIVTDLHEKSFGRVWQYFVSWGDFGFFRRGLLGTILTETGTNRLIGNEYIFAYVFYSIALAALYCLIYRSLRKLDGSAPALLLSLVTLYSPALFTHLGYATGNNDVVLLLIFTVALFHTKNSVAFGILLAAGLLVHELFMFMLPSAVWIRYCLNEQESGGIRSLVIACSFSGVVVLLLLLFGTPPLAATDFNSVMERKLPNAAYQHPLWSGYFEITSSLSSNLQTDNSLLENLGNNLWRMAIPSLYAVALAMYSAFYLIGSNFRRVVLAFSLLAPFTAQIVAGDFYRWVSMSASLSLLFLIYAYPRQRTPLHKHFLALALAFTIFAPFGAAELARPFPMHQFVLEKIKD